MFTKIVVGLLAALCVSQVFAQAKTNSVEPSKTAPVAEPLKVESTAAGKLELPVPLSQAPNSKSPTNEVKRPMTPGQPASPSQAPSQQAESVPPMQPLDGKAIEDIQARLGAGKRAAKRKPEFELVRIADVENRKSAIVEKNGIRSRIYVGSALGKFFVRDIEAESICLVDSVAAKKCAKVLTFVEGE